MMHFKRYTFLALLCVLHVFHSVLCTDNLYESISPYVQDSEIVDPQSLYYNKHSQKVQAPKGYERVEGDTNQMAVRSSNSHQSYCRDSPDEVFSRRLINMLIMKSNFKISDGVAVGNLDLEATVEELEMLKSFGDGKISIRQVDEIISNVIRQAQISLFDEALDYTDRFSIYIYQHRVIFGAVLLTIFIIAIALKVKWTRLRIIFLLVDVMVIFSFMLTWWELLQEVEIKLAAQQTIYRSMPDECQQDKLGFMRSVGLFFGFGKGDCIKYYEAIMTDPVLKVTPLHAFSHMCAKFFFHPLALAGHYMSDFIDGLTEQIPFPFNHLVKVVLVLFMPGLLGALLFISLGGSMGVRFGPFLHVYLHGRQATPPPNALNSNDRQAIEIIKSEHSETSASISEQTKSALPASTETPRKVKFTTQITQTETKPEENSNQKSITDGKIKDKKENSDTSSEDFPEEEEYEKISRTRLEDEIKENVQPDPQNDELKEEKDDSGLNLDCRNKTSFQVRKRILEEPNS